MFPSSLSSADPTTRDPAPSSTTRNRTDSFAMTAANALGPCPFSSSSSSSNSIMTGSRRRSASAAMDNLPLDAPPSLLIQSEILARLAHGPTLLPSSLAHLISAISVCSRVSIRSAALFIEAILESIRQGTTAGLGLTRRALISAVASARTLHYVANGLDWDGRNAQGERDIGLYLGLLDRYTNLGIYVINHTFTLAELFSLAGLSLTMSTTSLAFATAEESVRMLDSLLGSGETSRALSAIIALVRTEMAEDPNFKIIDDGVISTLALLTKTLTAFVCLQVSPTCESHLLHRLFSMVFMFRFVRFEQAATSKRTAKEMRMRVVYDCTVVAEGEETITGYVPFPTTTQGSADEHSSAHALEDHYVREHRRSRASSIELAGQELRRDPHGSLLGSTSPRLMRSRTKSVGYENIDVQRKEREEREEETEIVEELNELCGLDQDQTAFESDQVEADDAVAKLPPEVSAALEELKHSAAGKTIVTSSMGSHYEVEVTETTTTTTTTVRATASTMGGDGYSTRTLSRRTAPRTRPLSSIFQIAVPQASDVEEGDVSMDEAGDSSPGSSSDEWVDVGKQSPKQQPDDVFGPEESVAAGPEEEGSRNAKLQVVFRTMTSKFTKRKRTFRRVDHKETVTTTSTSIPSSGESTPRPRRIAVSSEVEEPCSPDSAASRKSPGRILKALGKALMCNPSVENVSSSSPPMSSRSSRTMSRESTHSAGSTEQVSRLPSTPPRMSGMTTLAQINDMRSPTASCASSRRPSLSDLAITSRRGSKAPLEPLNLTGAQVPTHTSTSSAPVPKLRRAESMVSIVTTCKHSQATPMEEPEPKASNFPRQHLVANLQRFMRYSSAAYGQAFLRILGLGKSRGLDFSFPNTKSHANSHAFAHHVGIPVDDILLDSYTTPGGGIFDNHRISPIVTYLAVDHEMKAIVLSCRGSLGLSDVLVDLVCSYEQIHVPDGDPMALYQVHAGMWHAATRLQRGLVHKTIKEALEQYPSYGLVLTGHSLGGGVSSLLSLLWSTPSHVFERNRRPVDIGRHPPIHTPFVTSFASGLPAGRPIHCYVFGPPCVASPDLGRYCQGLVTSTTHNNDVVPTLSIGSLRDLKTMAMNLHEDGGTGTTREIIGRVCGIYQRKIALATSERLYRGLPGGSEKETPSLHDVSDEARLVALTKAEIRAGRGKNRALDPAYCDPTLLQESEDPEDVVVNDYLWSVMRTLRADNDNDKLYPPGNVFVVENYTVFISSESRPGQYARREGRRILLRAVDNVEKRFAEPVFGKTLFMDHSPTGYEENVDLLARAVLG
ncbi:BZ3500_MvSof-1268-A1-R1_Chr5-3g08187 [Microbotryum saponariae]|uniref:sn-1-specific diacylglycerol lipase n=1 Tax=Microbotryum saponariae TaxID=289078 RepID=A0A2X0KL65_9BASI|nr:BZ3500_MvSof-1268-A1-R1_Chr5-3g08187 [Microbotryum saponariae]SDA07946.1 BZ3501_MvSof-1269-A2-R1_Chr5-1g07331 [Microbotryum saponariae]